MKIKKYILTVILGLLIGTSVIAQSNLEDRAEKRAHQAVEKVEATLELTTKEKENYFELKKTQLLNHFGLAKELKESNPDKFKEKVRENSQQFRKNVLEAFGNKRGREVLNAAIKKKE